MEQKQKIDTTENDTTVTSRNIVISKNQKKILTKSQQKFNQLVKKIEFLQQKIQEESKMLDENLAYYGTYIHPLETDILVLRKSLVKLLYKTYSNKKIVSAGDKKIMREIISLQLNEIFHIDKNEPEEEIKIIFEKIEGISYNDAAKEDFDNMRDEMESMFEEMGVDVDLSDMCEKMTQEDMMRKMKEIQEKAIQQEEEKNAKRAARKKTKKQLEKEGQRHQIEEARKRNIGSIYKQLAKVLHPDLEINESKKVEKQELMKQLVIAYEKNDLHTLLQLELQWIYKEENNLETLSEEKINIYVQVLKEQVEELEFEKHSIINHPKYFPLQKFNSFPFSRGLNLPKEKQRMESLVNEMKKSNTLLSGEGFLKEIKSCIKQFKSQRGRGNEWEDALNEFM